ncbi:MAG: polyprenyl synthetase family protein [Polyangiaceae bacterium]|nr:polyprenyl synthetase family protein [Polyangiaceae bacterium]
MDALVRTTDAVTVPARLEQRLTDVQAALAGDLTKVETALRGAAREGPSPGVDAARHLVENGGKRVRPLALLLSAACFGPITDAARELAVVVELVHSATLLHDDVIDDGDERRGAETARRVWGNAVSVLGGDLLLVHALERTSRAAPAVLPSLIETLRRLVDGEIVQLRGRTSLDASEATYERVLRDKTASLFGFATRTGALIAGAPADAQEKMEQFGERLGVAFQLVDDLLDYASPDTGKTPLADLREGKLTLPLVLAAARSPELLEPLARIHAGDLSPVEHVSRAVIESGVCDVVRERAAKTTASALDALRALAPGPARTLLEGVAQELAARAA